METKYKPYIILVMFSIAVITLEMAVYGDEISASLDEQELGFDAVPTFPTDFWHVNLIVWSFDMPNLISWFWFFIGMLTYLFTMLGIALTLPIDDIPIIVRIVMLAPIWIMVIVLSYNAIRAFIKAIGDIVPL